MLDLATRLVLSPVLVAQALTVHHGAQSLPEAAGPRHGTLGTGPALRLRIIGDSSAAGVGVAHQDAALAGQLTGMLARDFGVTWDLDAITGATTRSTVQRLATRAPVNTDVIVTALGVNDVTRQVPAWLWLRQQRILLVCLRDLYAPRLIYISGMAPMEHFPLLPNPLRWTLARHARKLEKALARETAGQAGLIHVPFAATPAPDLIAGDGFHPSARLYSLWAKEMASRIKTDWPAPFSHHL